MSNLPELRAYQAQTATETHDRNRLAYFWSPRLGKSLIAIDFLLKRSACRSVITCPLVVAPQWAQLVADAGLRPIIGFKGASKALGERLEGDGVLVINDDRLSACQSLIRKWRPDAMIVDESHRFRGVSTARGRAMRYLAKYTPLIRLLTGTPAPNHMGNLWGQLTAIDPDLWGTSFEKFATRFLVRDAMFKTKVLGVINEEELRGMLLRSSHILRRENIFGGDAWQTIVRNVPLPPSARRLYERIVSEWVAEGTQGKGETFAATHMLTRLLRLQQLTSGYLPDIEGTIHEIHTAKIDMVINDLEEIVQSGEKAVLFHKFTWEGETYAREIEHRLGCRVVSINGATSPSNRENAIAAINGAGPSCVAVVQTQAGGIGISLAGATHALFVSQLFSFDEEEQARDRIFAPGQSKCVTYYRCPNTVDVYIAGILEGKQSIHDAVRSADISELAYGTPVIQRKGVK